MNKFLKSVNKTIKRMGTAHELTAQVKGGPQSVTNQRIPRCIGQWKVATRWIPRKRLARATIPSLKGMDERLSVGFPLAGLVLLVADGKRLPDLKQLSLGRFGRGLLL